MKKRYVLGILLAMMTAATAAALTAGCDESESSVTWETSHVTVSVKGYDTVPKSVEPGTTLSLSVACEEGYGNAAVTLDGQAVQSEGDLYAVTVEKSGNIKVSAEKIVSVSGERKDAAFYVGDVITSDDVTVTVKYESGTEEIVSDFSVNYTDGNELSFGDTSFAVEYHGVKSESVTIPAVKGKIVIHTGYATLADSYESYLNGMGLTAMEDVELHTLTIPYSTLPEDLFLPAANDIEAISEDYKLKAWTIAGSAATKVSKEIRENIYVYPQFTLDAVSLTSVRIESLDETPMLILEGKYLYDVDALKLLIRSGATELESGAVHGKTGEAFRIEYDLTNLSANDSLKYVWLDLVLSYDGNSMDIDLSELSNVVDMTQTIVDETHQYQFQQWDNLLKITFGDAPVKEETVTTLKIAVQDKGDRDNATVVFTGKIHNEAYFSKTVCIDAQNNSNWGYSYWYADIDASGNWTMTLDLTEANGFIGDVVYMHFAIVEPDDHSNVLYKNGDYGNLANEWCENDDLVEMSVSDITKGLSCADDSHTYYIGLGWDGIKMAIAAK
ncbi:MAG: hypothetical protein J6D37_06550 [Clostridia bacterium]|nr:hypothetical protein [Clostridia bacterium]